MMPIIVRPWETGNLRKILVVPPFSNPTQYHQDRPLIWLRPFEEISGTIPRSNNNAGASSSSSSSAQKIRIRPFNEILDQDEEEAEQERRPKVYVRSLADIVQDTGAPITKPRKYFVRRWRLEKIMPTASKTKHFIINNSNRSSDVMPKIVSVTSVRDDETNIYDRRTEPLEPPSSSEPSEPLNLSKTDKSSQYFPRESNQKKKEYTFEKIIIDQKPQVFQTQSTTFEKKYSPVTGPYYDCPHCLQKYVSPLDVTEHLVSCAKLPEKEPVAVPSPAPSVQVELIDLEEEYEDNDGDGDDLDKDPDFVPLSSSSVATATENNEKSPTTASAESSNGKFTCDFPGCKKLFSTRGGMRGHSRSHKVSNNVFKCPECSSQFSWKAQLKSHFIKRHPKLASITTAELDKYRMSPAIIANSISAAVSSLSCGNDKKNVSNPSSSPKSKSSSSSSSGPQGSGSGGGVRRKSGKHKDSGIENFCSQCNLRFSTAHEYLAHDMQHRIDIEKNFTCKICNRGFFRRGYLIEHEKSHGQVILS